MKKICVTQYNKLSNNFPFITFYRVVVMTFFVCGHLVQFAFEGQIFFYYIVKTIVKDFE